MNIHKLLAEYGSPAYVYDLRRVRESRDALVNELPERATLYYSLKANPHPIIVRELMGTGCQAEVSSVGELHTALNYGADPGHCLYTGPGKTTQEILSALRGGTLHFSIDSPGDLARVAKAAARESKQVAILIRINPDAPSGGISLAMGGGPSQFGADANWVKRAPEQFTGNKWAQVVGFHVYTGTNVGTKETLFRTFEVAISLALELSDALGIDLELLDLGGGFGHPFATSGDPHDISGLRAFLERLLDHRLGRWRDGYPQVVFESGRYLVAGSGTLYSTVQDVKTSKGRRFVVLDTGIHHLGGMSGLRRVPPINPTVIRVDGVIADSEQRPTDVVGPLCTPLDYLARGIGLPDLCADDVLAIPNVGAYGLTASLLGFLSREPPVEIVIDDEEVVDVSQIRIHRSTRL